MISRRLPYRREHEEFFDLAANQPVGARCRTESLHDVRRLAKKYWKSQKRQVKFVTDTILKRANYSPVRARRDSCVDSPAIVIGNGPSRAMLSPQLLRSFQDLGGMAYCVNYFGVDDAFSGIAPDVLTVSDPSMMNDIIDLLERTGTRPKVLAAPLKRVRDSDRRELERRGVTFLGFCDDEIRFRPSFRESMSIRPDRPRSYESMTLYKALALALWMGHSRVFVIGMDNTYPRDLYCDPENHLWHRERHADRDDSRTDWSQLYCSVGDALLGFSLLFTDLRKFRDDRILNLDCYSLTDAFAKVGPDVSLESVLLA